MQKIKVILFLMLSICILSSCGNDKNTTEENKKSEKSDYNGIKEIDFSNNKDLEEINILLNKSKYSNLELDKTEILEKVNSFLNKK